MICSGGRLRHFLNLSENVFYVGHTKKINYITCQLIETGHDVWTRRGT